MGSEQRDVHQHAAEFKHKELFKEENIDLKIHNIKRQQFKGIKGLN